MLEYDENELQNNVGNIINFMLLNIIVYLNYDKFS